MGDRQRDQRRAADGARTVAAVPLVRLRQGRGSDRADRRDGDRLRATLLWQHTRMKNKLSSSVLLDGYVYGLDEGILSCLDADTGQVAWKGGRYGHGQLILAGDRLLITTETGELALVHATPSRFEELARVPGHRGPHLERARRSRTASCSSVTPARWPPSTCASRLPCGHGRHDRLAETRQRLEGDPRGRSRRHPPRGAGAVRPRDPGRAGTGRADPRRAQPRRRRRAASLHPRQPAGRRTDHAERRDRGRDAGDRDPRISTARCATWPRRRIPHALASSSRGAEERRLELGATAAKPPPRSSPTR